MAGFEKAKDLKEERITLEHLEGSDYQSSDDSEVLSDESLNEFWKIEKTELAKESKLHKERMKMMLFDKSNKVEVDDKLDQFLNIHSINLTSSVRKYIENSKLRKMTDTETISQLGLVVYERKRFLRALKIVETRFQRRLKEVEMLAKAKARQGMDMILKQCNVLFREEWGRIVSQYNTMRDGLYTAEQQLFQAEAQNFYFEKEVSQLNSYISSQRPKRLPRYVEDFTEDPDITELDELAISEANCILEQPINFYGGYLMQMMYKKNEVLTHAVV